MIILVLIMMIMMMLIILVKLIRIIMLIKRIIINLYFTFMNMYISVKFLLYNFITKIYHFPHCNYQNHISLGCPRPLHADWKPYSPFLILKLSIQILTALFLHVCQAKCTLGLWTRIPDPFIFPHFLQVLFAWLLWSEGVLWYPGWKGSSSGWWRGPLARRSWELSPRPPESSGGSLVQGFFSKSRSWQG